MPITLNDAQRIIDKAIKITYHLPHLTFTKYLQIDKTDIITLNNINKIEKCKLIHLIKYNRRKIEYKHKNKSRYTWTLENTKIVIQKKNESKCHIEHDIKIKILNE